MKEYKINNIFTGNKSIEEVIKAYLLMYLENNYGI